MTVSLAPESHTVTVYSFVLCSSFTAAASAYNIKWISVFVCALDENGADMRDNYGLHMMSCPVSSRATLWPDSTNVVVVGSSMSAGPGIDDPIGSRLRS
jgi:hypothetical protein